MLELFFGKIFQKLGIKFEKIAVSPYKAAFDSFTALDGMSEEARENQEWLLQEAYISACEKISRGRGITLKEAEEAIATAPHTPKAAVELNLIDHISNTVDLPEILGSSKKPATIETLATLKGRVPLPPPLPGKFIAVVSLEGMILPGKSQRSPFPTGIPGLGDLIIGDQTVSSAMHSLTKNSNVKGVILYINSPGGSVAASERIRASIAALASIKPVYIYFGDVSASGGYYISTPAKKIFSPSSTLTGSIGVVAGRFALGEFLDNIGIGTETMTRGSHASWMTNLDPVEEEERHSFENMIKDAYQNFKSIVSKSRNIPEEQLDELGLGRVWTGQQALEKGLIDGIGSFKETQQALMADLNQDLKSFTMYYQRSDITPPGIVNPGGWISETQNLVRKLQTNNIWLIPMEFSLIRAPS